MYNNYMIEDNKTNNMPKIIFGFDKDWELENWYQSCTQEAIYGLKNNTNKWNLGDIPQEIIEIINSNLKKEALEKIRLILDRFAELPESIQLMSKRIDMAQRGWAKIADQYFTRLSNMLNIPITEFEPAFYAYYTFGARCPFTGNKFMFSRFNDISNAASHEIMHIEFLKKYKNHCKENGLSDEQVAHLKEILTVILNEDMKDILYHPDYGYTKHQEIRNKVLEIYLQYKKSNSSFIEFLDKVIGLVKTQF